MVGHVGAAGAGHEQHGTRFKNLFADRRCGPQPDRSRCGRNSGLDHVAADADHFTVRINKGTVSGIEFAGLGQQNLDAKFLDHSQRHGVDVGDRIIGEDLLRLERMAQLAVTF